MRKKRFLWTCLALMTIWLQGSAFPVYGDSLDGYFDSMEGDTIVGWGWEASHPNTVVPVEITVTNKETSQVVGSFSPTAAVYRTDLKESGIGNGMHGFRIPMDWDSLPDGVYEIEGQVNGRKFGNTQSYIKGDIPQKETQPEEEAVPKEENAPAAVTASRSLGIFRTTGYCPCSRCCGKWGKRTSTGAIPRANHTVAVDPRVIPYGTKLMINGIVYTAEDCGSGVNGKHIDIYYDTHGQARKHGLRSQEVFLVQ